MTTDTGLTNRLRQHSRRAGLAVGLTMALTIAICVGGFAVIYAQLQPYIRDFVSQEPPVDDAFAVGPVIGTQDEAAAPTAAPEAPTVAAAAPPQTPAEAPPPPPPTDTPAPAPTAAGFTPDYQLRGEEQVNLRAGPGTEFEVVIVLIPLQPLRYLGEEAPTNDPATDGNRWMRFETENGEQGWVREVDVEPYDPNA